ncbi:MAG: nucleotidyl transferase AbiEii/AbiGii toxin family protein [Acidimicrobiales bacterium]|nr:MAG: nucleotidyl transferase AbiEii/AbiGii toxin family protein [Acidimicrobiales bacterium]
MYETPSALEAALKSRAQGVARRLGINTQDVTRHFYFQRLLARVFQEPGWMLKGGQALLVRYPGEARYSRDIDLIRPGLDDLNEAVNTLRCAAHRDLGDYFAFVETRPARHADEADCAQMTFDVLLGNRKMDTANVDLVVRRMPTAEPMAVQLEPTVPLPWPNDWPKILLYPLPDHLADKICAMYEWHWRSYGASPSTRYRDLADLLLISQQEPIIGRAVQVALNSEQRRRIGIGTDLRMPRRFEIPALSSWRQNYPAAAADVVGLRGCQTLHDATVAADAFVTPLLSHADPGTWNPTSRCWSALSI